ncbi:MAG: M1 family aminopeptidase [Vicinamibacterales bacterium]
MRLAVLLTALGAWAFPAAAQTAMPAAGVPLDVATRRAAVIADLRYNLQLAVPKALADPVTGTTAITFELRDNTEPLVIDFETSRDHVKSVSANGAATHFEYVNGHIVVPTTALKVGRNAVEIGFTAGNDPLNRSADFLYALFVPARARQAIPVFDQPDLKARWTLHLIYPRAWRAVSNGAEATGHVAVPDRSSAPPVQRAPDAEMASIAFRETEPLSTYLFSFVVGDFKVETAERRGRTFRMFHRETDAAKVARNREAIFDLHAAAIEYMERYTGIPYAFGKFDFVLIPAFQFGGMEHAGKILYNASGLMLDESATQNQLLGRASVISHETAHMWFGDLVTMRWFNDVWMKEVFANFMAAKIVNPSFPEVNHELRFLLAHYPAAYEVDRTPGANPIRQVLENLNEAGQMYGAIIYQKAPVMMRHLEALLGEESFRDGLREYLAAHKFGNATWTDLIDVLDRRTPVDLQAWSKVWVEQPGRPTVTTELSVSDGRITRLAFRQRDTWNRGRAWPQQLRVAFGDAAGSTKTLNVALDGASVEVKEAVGLPAPAFVLPNGEGWAYGGFELDEASLAYLSRSLPSVKDPLTRGSAWVTLWDALLDGRLAPTAFMDLAAAALPVETDEQLTARVLGYAGRAWWRFLPAEARTARASAFEKLLVDGVGRAKTASQKAAWFAAVRNVAITGPTVEWLRRVWAKKDVVQGLPLAEADYTTLALELALREVDGWREILAEQLTRIENPDRKGRFQFVMPALSADPKERDAWFRSLADVKNRRREPWVLEGLDYLHHPLRARASAGYVTPSLEMLWEIQKTGDIFFPKRWLDATLGGHRSPEVASMVREFLAGLPANYPERLKNITLQSADELFRVERTTP